MSAATPLPVKPLARGSEPAPCEVPAAIWAVTPMASISMAGGFGFLPDPSQFLRRQRPQQRQQKQKQRQGQRRTRGQPSGWTEGEAVPSSGEPTSSSSSSSSSSPGGAGGSEAITASKGSGSSAPGQLPSPLSLLGPLAALAPFGPGGQLQCPPAIIKMRVAVAALKPVRDLRPRALPLRALGLMAATVAANVPCGMWREHTRKFSPQWFLAVHVTIPFVASLRKAVLMPRWALLLTVAGAVGGQAVGAQLARQRLAVQQGPG